MGICAYYAFIRKAWAESEHPRNHGKFAAVGRAAAAVAHKVKQKLTFAAGSAIPFVGGKLRWSVPEPKSRVGKVRRLVARRLFGMAGGMLVAGGVTAAARHVLRSQLTARARKQAQAARRAAGPPLGGVAERVHEGPPALDPHYGQVPYRGRDRKPFDRGAWAEHVEQHKAFGYHLCARMRKGWSQTEEQKHPRDHGRFSRKPGAKGKAGASKRKPEGGRIKPRDAFHLAYLLGGLAAGVGGGYVAGKFGGGGAGAQPSTPPGPARTGGPRPQTRAERVREEAEQAASGRRGGRWTGPPDHRTTTFTAAGQTYTFTDRATPDIGLPVPSRSFIFADDADSHGRTGRAGVAGASDVFRQASAAAAEALASGGYPMVSFTADDPRRASLYKLLARSTVSALPGYSAFSYTVTRGEKTLTQFVVVKDEHRAAVEVFFRKHGAELQPVERRERKAIRYVPYWERVGWPAYLRKCLARGAERAEGTGR